jgi:hypothetical protein
VEALFLIFLQKKAVTQNPTIPFFLELITPFLVENEKRNGFAKKIIKSIVPE